MHPMSQRCYIVAVWHHLIKQILHKIKQNTIAKNIGIIGIFFPVLVFIFFQIPQQPTSMIITLVDTRHLCMTATASQGSNLVCMLFKWQRNEVDFPLLFQLA
jgi:hypothetical protein